MPEPTTEPPSGDKSSNQNSEVCHAELHCRLMALEGKVKSLEPSGKDGWEKAEVIGSYLMPIATAILGFFLIESVNQGFERQKIQIEGASQMQAVLTQMNEESITQQKAEASAVTLATFGQHAIAPLVLQLDSGDANREIGAKVGLRAVGMTEPEITCQRLSGVLNNRSRLYRWSTHRHALELIGDLGCQEAGAALQTYEQLLKGGLAGYRAVVSEAREPTDESLDLLRQKLERTKEILRNLQAAGS